MVLKPLSSRRQVIGQSRRKIKLFRPGLSAVLLCLDSCITFFLPRSMRATKRGLLIVGRLLAPSLCCILVYPCLLRVLCCVLCYVLHCVVFCVYRYIMCLRYVFRRMCMRIICMCIICMCIMCIIVCVCTKSFVAVVSFTI